MDVSIIIVNYNTKKLLKSCINSIIDKTKGVSYEIIVVDNCSTETIDDLPLIYPTVSFLFSKENLGFGKANNLGYQQSCGEMIFMLNPDTLLLNNAICLLYGFLKENRDKSIVGGALFDEFGNKMHSYGELFPSIKWEVNRMLRNRFSKKLSHEINERVIKQGFAEVAYITGADLMIKRDIIEQYGLFDPDFFMYFEESELAFRYYQKGYKSYFYPASQIVHLEGKSFIVSDARVKRYYEGRKVYYKKTNTTLLTFISNTIHIVADLYILLYCALRNRTKFSYYLQDLRIFLNVNN